MSDQDAYSPQSVVIQKEKGGCGCFAIGCLSLVGLSLIALVVMVGGSFWYIRTQVQKYTSETPAEIPIVEYTEEQIAELQARIDAFKVGVDGSAAAPEPSDPPVPQVQELVLTAEEINALIATEEQLRGRVHVSIDEGEISGDVSIPMDMFPGGGSRFLNASATFNVSLENGVLIVKVTQAEVKGEPLPEALMQEFRKQNLAKDFYKDEQNAEMIRRFESIRIEDDKLILRLRESSVAAGSDSQTDAATPLDEAPTPLSASEELEATESATGDEQSGEGGVSSERAEQPLETP